MANPRRLQYCAVVSDICTVSESEPPASPRKLFALVDHAISGTSYLPLALKRSGQVLHRVDEISRCDPPRSTTCSCYAVL
mmetsp:Transcript_14584/g.58253  ORF Transcript_14584/g.58253 Transcript_14584/m.58253 type:complete len:80 (+) Transcript_14584:566-805(+)